MIYDANTYWGRQGLERAILDALAAAGKEIDRLTVDDLAPADQFHSGGKNSTVRLARLASLKPVMRVLDVGGGLGGPARTLAAEFGCQVTVVDPTESYVRTGGSAIGPATLWRSTRPAACSTSSGRRTAA